ncbi:MAG: restriction endonuclease subunit S [Gammaproteobacteria bacterium]
MKLDDIATLSLGKTPSRSNPKFWDKEKNSKNIWLSIADLSASNHLYIEDSKEYLSDEGAKLFKEVPEKTLIMSFKLSIGKLAITKCALRTNEAIIAMPIKDEKLISKEYLYYFLSSLNWDVLAGKDIKVKGKTLNKAKLKELPISFPPLSEQERIVAKLDAAFAEIDEAIEVADKCVANSIAVYETHLDKIFSELSVSYSKQSMYEACDLIDSLHKTPKYTDNGYPMIRVADVKPGKIDFDNAKRVDEATFIEFSKRHTARKGDIILSRVGSYGVSAIVSENIDFCLGQNTVFVIPKGNSEYLYFFLNSPFAQRQMDSLISGVAQPTISLKSIKSLSIPIPSEEKQVEVSENFEQLWLETQKISAIFKRKSVLLEKLKLSILKQELLPSEAA